jgi:hypothetical protein
MSVSSATTRALAPVESPTSRRHVNLHIVTVQRLHVTSMASGSPSVVCCHRYPAAPNPGRSISCSSPARRSIRDGRPRGLSTPALHNAVGRPHHVVDPALAVGDTEEAHFTPTSVPRALGDPTALR